MPHIASVPVGYMDILKEKIRVISPCAVKKKEGKTMMTVP